jgi:hypothetical protein
VRGEAAASTEATLAGGASSASWPLSGGARRRRRARPMTQCIIVSRRACAAARRVASSARGDAEDSRAPSDPPPSLARASLHLARTLALRGDVAKPAIASTLLGSTSGAQPSDPRGSDSAGGRCGMARGALALLLLGRPSGRPSMAAAQKRPGSAERSVASSLELTRPPGRAAHAPLPVRAVPGR